RVGGRKGPRPDARLGGFRLVLLRGLIPAPAICQRPTAPHQPSVDIGPVGIEAGRENAMVAIEAAGLASEVVRADVAPELLRGGLTTRPSLPAGVATGLLPLGSINAPQANAGSGYSDA